MWSSKPLPPPKSDPLSKSCSTCRSSLALTLFTVGKSLHMAHNSLCFLLKSNTESGRSWQGYLVAGTATVAALAVLDLHAPDMGYALKQLYQSRMSQLPQKLVLAFRHKSVGRTRDPRSALSVKGRVSTYGIRSTTTLRRSEAARNSMLHIGSSIAFNTFGALHRRYFRFKSSWLAPSEAQSKSIWTEDK